jgi:hypothetical protein
MNIQILAFILMRLSQLRRLVVIILPFLSAIPTMAVGANGQVHAQILDPSEIIGSKAINPSPTLLTAIESGSAKFYDSSQKTTYKTQEVRELSPGKKVAIISIIRDY